MYVRGAGRRGYLVPETALEAALALGDGLIIIKTELDLGKVIFDFFRGQARHFDAFLRGEIARGQPGTRADFSFGGQLLVDIAVAARGIYRCCWPLPGPRQSP